jgi:hypothetical protein
LRLLQHRNNSVIPIKALLYRVGRLITTIFMHRNNSVIPSKLLTHSNKYTLLLLQSQYLYVTAIKPGMSVVSLSRYPIGMKKRRERSISHHSGICQKYHKCAREFELEWKSQTSVQSTANPVFFRRRKESQSR